MGWIPRHIRRWIRGSGLTWAVHSTVDEPLELLCAFVAHYLALGAAEVHLCLDRPTQEVIDVLGPVPGVRLTLCDEAYWAGTRQGRRPAGPAHRQVANLKRAYAESRHDWLLYCDADEFVHLDSRFGAMAEVLALFGEDMRFHIFPPAERFYAEGAPALSIFDGMYRCSSAGMIDAAPAIYGKDMPFYAHGLLQDGPGKSVLRCGLAMELEVHAPKDRTNGVIRAGAEEMAALERCRLLHFDGLTPLHWSMKLVRWYGAMIDMLGGDRALVAQRRTPTRNLQAKALYDLREDAQALHRMTRLQSMTAAQMAELAAAGGLVDARPQIEATARALFPRLELDFSQAAFDRRLRQLHADFIKTSGFAL